MGNRCRKKKIGRVGQGKRMEMKEKASPLRKDASEQKKDQALCKEKEFESVFLFRNLFSGMVFSVSKVA